MAVDAERAAADVAAALAPQVPVPAAAAKTVIVTVAGANGAPGARYSVVVTPDPVQEGGFIRQSDSHRKHKKHSTRKAKHHKRKQTRQKHRK